MRRMPRTQLPIGALRALTVRASALWALAHTIVFFLLWLAGLIAGREDARLSWMNSGFIVVACALLSLVDARRRGEFVLWSNLGLSTAHFVLLAGLVAAFGELLLSHTVG